MEHLLVVSLAANIVLVLAVVLRDRITSPDGRKTTLLGMFFYALACLLVIGILIHGPVPEDHVAAEAQSVTESDN